TARTQEGDGPLYDLEISEAADLIRRRKITAVQLAESVLERAAQVEDRVIAYALAYSADSVLAQARAADKLLRRGTYLGALHGIPVGLKDIIFTKGILTEANSKLYRGFRPDFDATCVALLKAAGAVIVGKTHTVELASGDPAPTNNPWDLTRTPGGSSSGSGAGTAAGEFLAGIGSDTRGSVRIPSANCGITGYRTTYGMVSKHGVFPLSYTIDDVGTLARSALDAALLVDVMAGQDPEDPTTRPVQRYSLADALVPDRGRRPLRGIRVGVPAAGFTTLNWMSTPIVNSEVGAFQYQNWKARAGISRFRTAGRSTPATCRRTPTLTLSARADVVDAGVSGDVRRHRRVHPPGG
ncbi:MAG: aspartyl-tRNA(Asn)/glutamyl-tRNA(Gln) amidotransferase subunit, partial [Kribbellaceae bacterium]|nr:aspartyl-tRNA(Asn)/glutamyl-tRNA(Gln) amidotransferase subunit [Kribbellaceae bacterium]